MKDLEKIYNAYNNRAKGYIVTLEDYLNYLTDKGYNWALNKNQLIGNQMKAGSYFEIKDIKIGVTIENQDEEVIKQLADKII